MLLILFKVAVATHGFCASISNTIYQQQRHEQSRCTVRPDHPAMGSKGTIQVAQVMICFGLPHGEI
jgi:hypothetical protein